VLVIVMALRFLAPRFLARDTVANRTEVMDDVARAPQVAGGGAKKHRRLPSDRLQRQNSPSGEGWASANGIASYIDGPMPASGPWMIT